MAITNSFRDAVSSGNVKGIRIMMKDSLLVDPSFAEFDEMSRLAAGVSGLYDVHDGRELQQDRSAWDDNYMDKLMVQVIGNFSKERLAHLQAVVKYLRPNAVHSQGQSAAQRQSASGARPAERHVQPSKSWAKQKNAARKRQYGQQSAGSRSLEIACGAVAGAVIGGVVATVINVTVVGCVLVGAAAGSATVVFAANRK